MPSDDTKLNEPKYAPSNLETIDRALYDFVSKELDLHCTTNKGWKKTPVLWTAPERSFQIKNNKDLRDSSGALIFPLITVERTGVTKDPSKKGTAWGNIPPVNDFKKGSITIGRRVKQDKTANYANADSNKRVGQLNFRTRKRNEKIVYETVTIPMPVYITCTYNISIKTEYQQQMNELVQPFISTPGGINYFVMDSENNRYEGFINQDFSQENSVSSLDEGERYYITNIKIDVLGHVVGDGPNQETPKVVVRESAVEVKIQRERVMLGDINPFNDDEKYRP